MKTFVLPPDQDNRFREITEAVVYLGKCHPGKPVRVDVRIAQPDKTPQQNKYLWAVPYKMLERATGMEKEDLHEWNCGAQWGWRNKKVPKKPSCPEGYESVPIRTTTTNEHGEDDPCSFEEMQELWERCQRLGAKLDMVIPDPDPNWKNDVQSKSKKTDAARA